jgi:hypothetical protein
MQSSSCLFICNLVSSGDPNLPDLTEDIVINHNGQLERHNPVDFAGFDPFDRPSYHDVSLNHPPSTGVIL